MQLWSFAPPRPRDHLISGVHVPAYRLPLSLPQRMPAKVEWAMPYWRTSSELVMVHVRFAIDLIGITPNFRIGFASTKDRRALRRIMLGEPREEEYFWHFYVVNSCLLDVTLDCLLWESTQTCCSSPAARFTEAEEKGKNHIIIDLQFNRYDAMLYINGRLYSVELPHWLSKHLRLECAYLAVQVSCHRCEYLNFTVSEQAQSANGPIDALRHMLPARPVPAALI